MKHPITAALLGVGVLLAACAAARAWEDRAAMSRGQFAEQHAMIKRQPGEARYLDIEWHPTVWEARQKAAREGKPLFIWAGSEGAPSAGC